MMFVMQGRFNSVLLRTGRNGIDIAEIRRRKNRAIIPLTAVVRHPFLFVFKSTSLSANASTTEPVDTTNPLVQIRPLGLAWATVHPCLFCAHHTDSLGAAARQRS